MPVTFEDMQGQVMIAVRQIHEALGGIPTVIMVFPPAETKAPSPVVISANLDPTDMASAVAFAHNELETRGMHLALEIPMERQ
jgi:hypothetical protein